MLLMKSEAAGPVYRPAVERQCSLRNLLAEQRARLQEQKFHRSSRAKRRSVERRPCAEETLRTENASARSEERGLRRDPHRLEVSAELERMFAPHISQIFRGMEVLFAVVGDAALDSS